jgi:trehalose 6-phosphate phosphatase
MPPHLFAHWGRFLDRMTAAKHLALALDFDGTLVPIRRRPTQARLSDGTRRVLERLGRRPGLRVFLVSGRRLADLRRRARVSGASYLGLHGWEQDGESRRTADLRRTFRSLKRVLDTRLAGFRGIEIENKGCALAVHYRQASPATASRMQAVLGGALDSFDERVRVLGGKYAWEVLPRENRGKGFAVRSLVKRMPAGTLAVYLGDDTSDEAAFEALRGALTVRVGVRADPTHAQYRLRGPGEVRQFLERLDKETR